ncbi:hypothetical protein C7I84_24170 [Mesorhizobium ephedrae]|uniref:Class I SAM-dependent methyltransferase n=1 Tax=Kumtagia ephedrae TaxID=2116701 RepID=A0A2P7RVQ4_9HYPH|nr:hypothetical protein C7I84_24170 [Mesorhizobium ephedrae]
MLFGLTLKKKAASPEKTPTRKRGRSKESQGESWQRVLDKVEKFVVERPDDHIASLLARFRELDIGRKDPKLFYKKTNLVRPLGERIAASGGYDLDDTLYYPDVCEGRYTTSTVSVIRYLMGCIRSDTRAVVEFGSGWSSNLFQLYVALGTTRSRRIHYHGAEYTDEGQECGRKIAKHDGKINYTAHPFDYRKPDASFLKDCKGHVLVFTKHSVEQVDLIDPDLYEQLWQLQADVTLVHFEPVGWQRSSALMARRAADDDKFFDKIGERLGGDVKSVDRQMANAAWWSWRNAYNTNLLSIVEDYTAREKFKLVKREYDFSGTANVLNPSTLLHLERRA